MGRIVVMNHVTLDGVMQGPGRPEEDTRGGFTRGGWGHRADTPDDAVSKAMGGRMEAGGGLAGWLFGRRTYEHMAAYWPSAPHDEIADKMNITVPTVRTHLRHIYEKLHVRSRTEAIVKYLK